MILFFQFDCMIYRNRGLCSPQKVCGSNWNQFCNFAGLNRWTGSHCTYKQLHFLKQLRCFYSDWLNVDFVWSKNFWGLKTANSIFRNFIFFVPQGIMVRPNSSLKKVQPLDIFFLNQKLTKINDRNINFYEFDRKFYDVSLKFLLIYGV